MNTLFHLGTLRWFRRGPAISKIEEVRQELLQLGVKDVKVAPVGLDFSVMKSDFAAYDRAALRREFGLLPEDMVICTVGRMGPEKIRWIWWRSISKSENKSLASCFWWAKELKVKI